MNGGIFNITEDDIGINDKRTRYDLTQIIKSNNTQLFIISLIIIIFNILIN